MAGRSRAQRSTPPVEVHAAIDTSGIKIGEQFHLVLRAVTDSENKSIGWAAVPDTFNHLLVVGQSPIDTVKNKGHIIFQKVYTLTGFDSGRWTIPPFQFHPLGIKDSTSLEKYKTDSLFILIHSVPVDTSKPFKPIKEIRAVPFNILDYWPFLLAGLVVLLVILFFVFIYKKKGKVEKEEVVPMEPAYDQAVKNLQTLEQEKLWQNGKVKEYYSRLTDILRLYIQRQYQINALEQTTDELLEKIKHATRLNQQRDKLKYILEMADLAKFAKLSPTEEEHQACMKKAKDFVEWTKPLFKEEENEKEKDKNK